MLNKLINSQARTITSAAIIIGALSLVSRILGIFRDRILAAQFGAGDVLDTFIRPSDKITISAYWPLTEKEFISNQPLLSSEYVLVVYAYQENIPKSSKIRFIQKFEKPEKKSAVHLFELVK